MESEKTFTETASAIISDDLSYCHYCGKEIDKGRLFCPEDATPINKQIFEFFSQLPRNKYGQLIRPRGQKPFQFISEYLKARLGLSKHRQIIMKSFTGAGKSIILDMIALIELTHFPNSLTVIGSISESVAKIHIEVLREWVSSSVFKRYMEGTHEATASKTEIKLAKLNSKVISMPASPKTRTGWHATLLLLDEVGRMDPQAYFASFHQMSVRGGLEVSASTPYLNSSVMYNIWNSPDVVKIDITPEDAWWYDQDILRKEMERYEKANASELGEQLFGGKFRSQSSNVIPEDLLLSAIQLGYHLNSSSNLVMGIDFGRKIDFTAIVIIDIETGDVKYVDAFQDDWNIQYAKIRKCYKDWNPIRIIADKSHVGDVILSELRDLPIEGVSMHNDILKKAVIDRLIMAFYNHKVNIVADEFPRLVSELGNYIYFDAERTKMGPERGHDDIITALALALKGMDVSSIGYERQENLWKFTRIPKMTLQPSSKWGVSKIKR